MEKLAQTLETNMQAYTSRGDVPRCKAPGCTENARPVVAHPFKPGTAINGNYLEYCTEHQKEADEAYLKSEAWMLDRERQEEETARSKAELQKRWNREKPARFEAKLRVVGLEKLELRCRFGNFSQTEKNKTAFTVAHAFSRSDLKRGVILVSPPGCGKTHLASASVKVLAARGRRVKFYKVIDILGRLRGSFRDEAREHEEDIIEELASLDVLFLDDFGVERPTQYAEDALYRIIDRRYRRELPIFATSNLDLGELAKRIDDRIPSRLAGMCSVVKFNEADWRLKG